MFFFNALIAGPNVYILWHCKEWDFFSWAQTLFKIYLVLGISLEKACELLISISRLCTIFALVYIFEEKKPTKTFFQKIQWNWRKKNWARKFSKGHIDNLLPWKTYAWNFTTEKSRKCIYFMLEPSNIILMTVNAMSWQNKYAAPISNEKHCVHVSFWFHKNHSRNKKKRVQLWSRD